MKFLLVFILLFSSSVLYSQNIMVKLEFQFSKNIGFIDETRIRKVMVDSIFPLVEKKLNDTKNYNIHFYLENGKMQAVQIDAKYEMILYDTLSLQGRPMIVEKFRIYEPKLNINIIPSFQSGGGIGNSNESIEHNILSTLRMGLVSKSKIIPINGNKNKNITQEEAKKKNFFKNVVVKVITTEKSPEIMLITQLINKECLSTQEDYTRKSDNSYLNYYVISGKEKAPINLENILYFEILVEKIDANYKFSVILDPKKVETHVMLNVNLKDYLTFTLSEQIVKNSPIRINEKLGIIYSLIRSNVEW